MSDEVLRRLERTAAAGDPQAQAELRRELERIVTQDLFDQRNEELIQKLEDLLVVLSERTSEEILGARWERLVARRVEEIRRANGLMPAQKFMAVAALAEQVNGRAVAIVTDGQWQSPATGRQSGRTTEMLLCAAAAASLGRSIVVVAHDHNYARGLEAKGRDLLNWANLRGGENLRAVPAGGPGRPRRDESVFIDHHLGGL